MESTNMKTPSWKWEWNPNTLLQLISIISIIGGGGYSLAQLHATQSNLTNEIIDIKSRTVSLEALYRKTDIHELRISNIESAASESVNNIRTMQNSLNSLGSDIRVMREILQRIDSSNINNRQQ